MIKTEELRKIFQNIVNNNFSQKDYKSLINYIKNQLKYYIDFKYNEEDFDRVDDLLGEIICSLTKRLKKFKGDENSEIENPKAYLDEIIRNELYKYNVEYDKRYFKGIFNDILIEMEKSGILNSYNKRDRICLDGVTTSEMIDTDIINLSDSLPLNKVSFNNRYNKEFKEELKIFIENILSMVGCIKRTLLFMILSNKIGLNAGYLPFYPVHSEDDETNDPDDSFYDYASFTQEQLLMIEQLKSEYKNEIIKFINKKSDRNIKIVLAIYYHSYEKQTFEKIALRLKLNSPTTIHNWFVKNAYLLPENYIKTNFHKFVKSGIEDDILVNHVYDEFLLVLKETLIEYGLLEN